MIDEITERIKKDKVFRREAFKRSFFKYCNYYFREYYDFPTPSFLVPYYIALEQGKNVYFRGFRNCSKTTIAQMYINNCIAYKTRRNIMWYSQNIDNSEENLTYIANTFIGETDGGVRFIRDFGNLYYPDNNSRGGQKKIKRTNKFVTENECYVRAMSLGTSPRGKNFTASDGKHRPDLLILDDVDTLDSCSSKKKIDKNREFLLNEVLGGTTAGTQIIFLGNTIYNDGLVPRFEEHIKNNDDWVSIIQPIYDGDRNIVRERFVESKEEARKLNKDIREVKKQYISLEGERERLGSSSYQQNYLLQPINKGAQVITRDMLRFDTECLYYKFDKVQIGVDPAISEKEGADRYAITITGFLGEKRYVLESLGLEGGMKNIEKSSMLVKSIYSQYKANCIYVETVAFQRVLKTIFQKLGMAVKEVNPHRDKVTRLLEYQYLFEQGNVIFYPKATQKLVDEILTFPNGDYDDMVDSLVYSLTNKSGGLFFASL